MSRLHSHWSNHGNRVGAKAVSPRRREEGHECWSYSVKGARQILRPGTTCARCRVVGREGGCSISKRRKEAKKRVIRGPRRVAPHVPNMS